MKLNKNQVYSLCVIVFALIVIYATSQLDSLFQLSERDVGPKFFPYAAAVGMILCAIGKFITERNTSTPLFDKRGWIRAAVVFGLIALYLIAIWLVGYLIATPIFTALLVIAMKEDRKVKPVTVILFSVITTIVLYVVFEKIIMVFLPAGILWS